jgi:hypothetical protein
MGKRRYPGSWSKELARELDLSESMLDRLAEEVRKDMAPVKAASQNKKWGRVLSPAPPRNLLPDHHRGSLQFK